MIECLDMTMGDVKFVAAWIVIFGGLSYIGYKTRAVEMVAFLPSAMGFIGLLLGWAVTATVFIDLNYCHKGLGWIGALMLVPVFLVPLVAASKAIYDAWER